MEELKIGADGFSYPTEGGLGWGYAEESNGLVSVLWTGETFGRCARLGSVLEMNRQDYIEKGFKDSCSTETLLMFLHFSQSASPRVRIKALYGRQNLSVHAWH
jgi:hypothetical protein